MAYQYELPDINPKIAEELHERVELGLVDLPVALAGTLAHADRSPNPADWDREHVYFTEEGLQAGREVLTRLWTSAAELRGVKPGSSDASEINRATLEWFVAHSVDGLGGRVVQNDPHGHAAPWEVTGVSSLDFLLMRTGRLAGFTFEASDAEPVSPQRLSPIPRKPFTPEDLARKGAHRTLHHLARVDTTLTLLELHEAQPHDPGSTTELQQYWRVEGSHTDRERGGPRVLAAEYLARLADKMGAKIITAPAKEGDA